MLPIAILSSVNIALDVAGSDLSPPGRTMVQLLRAVPSFIKACSATSLAAKTSFSTSKTVGGAASLLQPHPILVTSTSLSIPSFSAARITFRFPSLSTRLFLCLSFDDDADVPCPSVVTTASHPSMAVSTSLYSKASPNTGRTRPNVSKSCTAAGVRTRATTWHASSWDNNFSITCRPTPRDPPATKTFLYDACSDDDNICNVVVVLVVA
mmetsp:Transcript_30744/g.47089  ORF Transcript_30744/g.47089 Transcript_30744/m.47089 type:complete len:210 (+) Transcript_30744:275-904(+)